MLKKLLLIALLAGLPFTSPAATLSYETGPGVKLGAYESNNYVNTSLILRVPAQKYTFTEIRWGFLDNAFTTSIAYGVETKGNVRLSASIGGAYLDNPPKELSGPLQFIISAGVSYHWSRLVLSGNARHLSNGEGVFGHGRQPNGGVEHVLLGVGVRF